MRPDPVVAIAARRAVAAALTRVAALAVAAAPVTAIAWAWSAWQRRRLATPAGARAALAAAGVDVPGPLRVRVLGGGRANAVVQVDAAARRLVIKRALPLGTVLARAARQVGPQPFPAALGRSARVDREHAALVRLAAAGVRVPAVLGVDRRGHTLVLEHLAGALLPRTAPTPGFARHVAAYGAALAAAHRAGVRLTDGHPGNALVTPDGAIALIDLEMAEVDRDPARAAFDLAYAARYFFAGERAALVAGFAAAGGALEPTALAAMAARVAPYAWLFDRERARQRARP